MVTDQLIQLAVRCRPSTVYDVAASFAIDSSSSRSYSDNFCFIAQYGLSATQYLNLRQESPTDLPVDMVNLAPQDLGLDAGSGYDDNRLTINGQQSTLMRVQPVPCSANAGCTQVEATDIAPTYGAFYSDVLTEGSLVLSGAVAPTAGMFCPSVGCTQVAATDIAPSYGAFYSDVLNEAMYVSPGAVAPAAGMFCPSVGCTQVAAAAVAPSYGAFYSDVNAVSLVLPGAVAPTAGMFCPLTSTTGNQLELSAHVDGTLYYLWSYSALRHTNYTTPVSSMAVQFVWPSLNAPKIETECTPESCSMRDGTVVLWSESGLDLEIRTLAELCGDQTVLDECASLSGPSFDAKCTRYAPCANYLADPSSNQHPPSSEIEVWFTASDEQFIDSATGDISCCCILCCMDVCMSLICCVQLCRTSSSLTGTTTVNHIIHNQLNNSSQ